MKGDRLYLIHISECIERIESYIGGKDKKEFMDSTLIQDAIIRNLKLLAESTQRLSDAAKERQSGIDWYKIAGFRNVLVHDYLGIDIEVGVEYPPEGLAGPEKGNSDNARRAIGSALSRQSQISNPLINCSLSPVLAYSFFYHGSRARRHGNLVSPKSKIIIREYPFFLAFPFPKV